MNKYLSGFVALCVLPMSAFAEEGVSTFDDDVLVSKKVVREYKSEKAPIVVYRQKDTPVSIVINKYNVEPSRNVQNGGLYEEAEDNNTAALPQKSKTVAADKVYKEKAPKGIRDGRFYMGLNGDLSFLSWTNKYSNPTESGTDKFNFKLLLGADVVAGYRVNENWRFDGEFGYIGKFSDKETGNDTGGVYKTEFDLQAYYADVNAYCDIAYGLYAGIGGGLAIVRLTADDSRVQEASSTNLSPMGALMLGWTYALDEKIDIDVRYRFSVFDGGDLNIGNAKIDAGTVLNNSLSLGVKYYF